jgi:squalene-hopene/tetraprenyl-beta-curcumene cyclase
MTRFATLFLLPIAAWCGDWNAKVAAQYLDGRAADWAVWKPAARTGGPCISCHTTLGYLLARPALRRDLGESSPTEFELGLLAGVRTRVASSLQKPPNPNQDNTQAVVAAFVLAMDDQRRGADLSTDTEAAFRDLWAKQRREGKDKGAWGWTDANLEPWEVPESPFFGAALAAVAVGAAPPSYQARPEIRQNLEDLRAYLREGQERQPLANRLLLLWAAARTAGLVTGAERQAILDEAWRTQNEDGGWTLAALGPWRDRPNAPRQASGSNAYPTAWTAFLLRQAGLKAEDPRLARALVWLRAHQDPGGFWAADSMNKRYEPGSMQERFMRDAATAYAVLALSGSN